MTTATMTKELSHAEQNATGWAEGIATAYETHAFCAEEGQGRYLSQAAKAMLRELGYDGTNHAQVLEAIEEQSREQPLSVEVRNGWHTPGEQDEDGPEEFCILLSTGGPALRIRGELSHGEPDRCWLEHQDWGTPWTRFYDADREALLWFAGLFWFGA
jgi:hypothetical protein